MGFFFEITAEFGDDDKACKSFADFFQHRTLKTSQGEYALTTYSSKSSSRYWCSVIPEGLSRTGINSQEDAFQMSIAGLEFYNLLKEIPIFQYCLAGVEVVMLVEEDDITNDPELILTFDGLVLTTDLYVNLGQPEGFVDFIPGYKWKPYLGEAFGDWKFSEAYK